VQFNKFFVHRVSQRKAVLITDVGNWVDVSPLELKAIREGKIGAKLLERLEEKKIVLSSRNKRSILRDYRLLYSPLNQGISLHIINPTMRCNHHCEYCYANSLALHSRGGNMDTETAKKTIDFIWQSPRKSMVIEFQGGEPLANFAAIQFIIDYAAKKRPRKNIWWRMVSNFSLMDETIARYLKSKGVTDLCTSLDGPKRLHEKNRPLRGGSYRKVVYWLDALRSDFGFKKVGVLCTVTKHSLPFAEEIVEEYLSQGLSDITPVAVREIGRAKDNWKKIGYGAEEYISFWKRVLNCCIEKTRRHTPITEQLSLLILRKLQGPMVAFHSCFSKPCGAALMQASYQPDGSVYTCDEGKAEELFRLGTVEQPYSEVFTSPSALNMVALSSSLGLLCNECKWSAYCSFCPVMAFSAQGSPIPLLYNNASCRIRKAQFSHIFEKLFSADRGVLRRWLDSGKDL
jgi:radical SAM protein with 4Fe4S-binding SPASM domain